MDRKHRLLIPTALFLLGVFAAVAWQPWKVKAAADVTTFSDYRSQKPGTFHKITVADIPQPYATEATRNNARLVPRPANAWPQAPQGFQVQQYFTGLENPRRMQTAPNGDLFLAESQPGRIHVFRGIT